MNQIKNGSITIGLMLNNPGLTNPNFIQIGIYLELISDLNAKYPEIYFNKRNHKLTTDI